MNWNFRKFKEKPLKYHVPHPTKKGKTACGRDLSSRLRIASNFEFGHPNGGGWGMCYSCKGVWLKYEAMKLKQCFLRLPDGMFSSFTDETIHGMNIPFALLELDKVTEGLVTQYFKLQATKNWLDQFYKEDKEDPDKIDYSIDMNTLEICEYSEGVAIVWDEKIKSRVEFAWWFLDALFHDIARGQNPILCQEVYDIYQEMVKSPDPEFS